jgi:hypothetical protein
MSFQNRVGGLNEMFMGVKSHIAYLLVKLDFISDSKKVLN